MAISVKICGLKDRAALDAAVEAGAGFVGFNFFARSPRVITPEAAGDLLRQVPARVQSVGVMVDPDDGFLTRAVAVMRLDAVQLHGQETPERVRAVKALTGKRVIKALGVGGRDDLDAVPAFAAVADMLLFDARPPTRPDALPGGNGLPFDWRLLQGLAPGRPWLLSGGLDVGNLAEACACSGAVLVDVSSGVESAPGVKDPMKIRAFLNLAAGLLPAGGV